MWGCGCSWTGSEALRRAERARPPAGRRRSGGPAGARTLVAVAVVLVALGLTTAPGWAAPRAEAPPRPAREALASSDTTPPVVPDTTPPQATDTTKAELPATAVPEADTVPPTTSDTLAAARRDSAAADTTRPTAPPFPEGLEPAPSVRALETRTWDRSDLMATSSRSLLDFLEWEVPGLTTIRAGYFAGPHLALDGLFGPGFVRVTIDGRQLDPLEGSAVDLFRIALVQVARITMVRGADGIQIDVTTLHHDEGPAYSSIEGGTGRPSLNTVRGAFANGIGTHVQLAAAGDFMQVQGGQTPSSWTDGWAKVDWMPFGKSVGLEVRGRSQSVERNIEGNEKFSRTDVDLHGRADLAPWLQVDAWAGRSRRSPSSSSSALSGTSAPAVPVVTDEMGSLAITAAGGSGFGRAAFRARNGSAYPTIQGEFEGGLGITSWLHVEVGGDVATWDRFETRSARLALSITPHMTGPVGVVLRGSAARGSRGVPRPLSLSSDSLTFDALAGSAGIRLGPYSLTGRGTWQRLSRQLPFGFGFDSALAPGAGATVGGFEGRADGPLIPFGALASRVRVRGWWRHEVRLSGGALRYVPGDEAFGAIEFRDSFFQDNLHLRAEFGALYRGVMATSRPGQSSAELLPAQTLTLGRAEIRIDRFRIWWAGHDLGMMDFGDVAGIPHPLAPNLVGVTWEWSD